MTAGSGSTVVDSLVSAFADSDPRLDIWRRWPDVSPAEDAFSDGFACEQVGNLFTQFANGNGWKAITIGADLAETPFVDYHVWTRLFRGAERWDVDWTVRQYHNLHEPGGRDPKILDLPWPLVWARPDDTHPVAGTFGRVRNLTALRAGFGMNA